MPTPEVVINEELAKADLAVTSGDIASAGKTCFARQLAIRPDVYDAATRKAMRDSIAAVRKLMSESRQVLVGQLSRTKAQVNVLRKKRDDIDTKEPQVVEFMRLLQPINTACPDAAQTALDVRETTDVLVAERREIEYRLFLATKAVNSVQLEIDSVSGTLASLDQMNLSLG